MRADRIRETFDVEIQWTHFPLHPDTPQEGMTLQDLFAGRSFDIAAAQSRLQGVMQQEGLPFGERTMTYNSRLAQELATWADEIRPASSIHTLLYQAYFLHGQNLADHTVLVDIAVQAGLPESDARDVIETRRYRPQVDADWQRSRELGVTGVPTYVAQDQRVVGAQSYEVLAQLVTAAGAQARDNH
ncbi:MAG: thioredoxin domain-containing protein [Planctomycetaceae bacterium]|nr:thioredoxin domain-containing protein [Planctomycetaceae bacterium]